MPFDAPALRSRKLTVLLATLLAGSVIVNIFIAGDTYFKPHSTSTTDASAANPGAGSAGESDASAVKRQEALRLRQIAGLSADIATHLSTVAALHRERAALLSKNAQTNQKLALTSQQLAISQKKLAATTAAARRVGTGTAVRLRSAIRRQFITGAGKLVPLLGTGVAAGSFGYDVYELCASIDDLAELNRAIGEPAKDDGVIDRMCRAARKGL